MTNLNSLDGRSSVQMRASALAKDGFTDRALLKTRKRIRNLVKHEAKGTMSERKKSLLIVLRDRERQLTGGATNV